MKNIVKIVIASFCMIFFSCCCRDCCEYGNTVVTYRVNSESNSSISVMFNNDYGDTELYRSVDPPWVYRFTIKERGMYYFGGDYDGHFPAYVSARNSGNNNDLLTVTIHVNGKLVESASTTVTRSTAEARYNIEL